MKASDIPSECLRDPQFIKVLTASLCSQIAESKKILADTDEEIQQLKDKVEQGLEKRKVLKQINKDLKQKKNMQDAMLESLERDRKNREIELDTIKNCLDDASLRQKADRAEYEKILNDYAIMWEKYKGEYEEFPLAKVREENRTTVRKLEIQEMIIEYKRDEFVKMLNQRKLIDAMRIRAAGVDIAEMVLKRWKDQKYLEHLQNVGKELRAELKNLDSEILQLQEEDERHKLAEIETSKMPPPRLDFSFIRSACAAERNFRTGRRNASRSPGRDSDTASVNTLILEEMCKEVSNDKTENDGEKSISSPQKKAEDIFTSAPMIQVSVPTEPFFAKSNNNPPETMSVDETNIQNKLQKLGIENTNAVTYDEESKCSNNDANEEANNDYADGSEESFLRTRRWCEESRKELAPYLLEERRSKSVSEQMPVESNDDEFKSVGKKKVPKALSSYGSEMKITSERSDVISSKCSLYNDKTIAEQFHNATRQTSNWNENFFQKSSSQVSHLGKRKRQQEISKIAEVPSRNDFYDRKGKSNDDANQTPGISRRNDDKSKMPIDEVNNRPKIMSVEKTNFLWKKQIGHTTATNVPDYASSYMSSDNFSNINEAAFMQQTPRDSFITECEDTPRYPLYPIGQNPSSNGAQSVASFISTIADDQLNNQNRCSPAKKNSPVPAMSFGGFFGIKKKDQNSMF